MTVGGRAPTVESALLVGGGTVLSLLVLNILAAPLSGWLESAGATPALLLGLSALLAELGIALPLLLVLWLGRLELRGALGLVRPPLVPTAWSLLAMLAGGVVLDEAMHLAVWWMPWLRTGSLDAVGRAIAEARPAELVLLVIPLVVLPALFEEALCRGLFLRGLLSRFATDGGWIAVVLSAAFFGSLHLDRLHAPVAASLGLLLGLIAIRTGSLWPPILCHLANNLVSLLTPALGGPSLSSVLDHGHAWPVVLLAILGLIAGLIGLFRTTSVSANLALPAKDDLRPSRP